MYSVLVMWRALVFKYFRLVQIRAGDSSKQRRLEPGTNTILGTSGARYPNYYEPVVLGTQAQEPVVLGKSWLFSEVNDTIRGIW